MAFDRFSEKPPRREKRFGARDESRFGEKRESRFGERRDERFSDRPSRFSDDRFEKKPGFGGKRFGAKKGFGSELGSRSGPRAKAVDVRRFSDRAAYLQNATVRLEPDVAEYFKSAEDVNAALRSVIALARLVKDTGAAAAAEETSAEAVSEEQDALSAADEEDLQD